MNIDLKPQDFIDKLFPNGFLGILTQLLALAVIVVIVFVFLFKPVRKILQTRAEAVEKEIEGSKKDRLLASDELDRASHNILVSQKEADKIISEAKKSAQEIKDEELSKAKLEALELKQNAALEIEGAKKKAYDDVRTSIVEVALTASSKVLERNIDTVDNQKFVDKFIEDLKNE